MANLLSDLPSRTQRQRQANLVPREQPIPRPSVGPQCAATTTDDSADGDSREGSRLHAIVTQHLRQQHRKACLRSAAPTSTLPPMSLLKRHELPQVRHPFSPDLQMILTLIFTRPYLTTEQPRTSLDSCALP